MKKLLLTTLLSAFLFSATPEQVDRYLSISNADEQLAELEEQFSRMQNNLNSIDPKKGESNYNMQMLSIRFKEYLETHLSESEMDEILQAYKNVLLLQYVSAVAQSQYTSEEEIDDYVRSLESDPQMQARIELVAKIAKEMYDTDALALMFDNLIKPLIENAPGGDKIDPDTLKKRREGYIEQMAEQMRKETLFATRDFTQEELEKLEQLAQEPAIKHESKAVFGATAYALEEFFLSLAKRYDISKHQ